MHTVNVAEVAEAIRSHCRKHQHDGILYYEAVASSEDGVVELYVAEGVVEGKKRIFIGVHLTEIESSILNHDLAVRAHVRHEFEAMDINSLLMYSTTFTQFRDNDKEANKQMFLEESEKTIAIYRDVSQVKAKVKLSQIVSFKDISRFYAILASLDELTYILPDQN